MRAIIHVLFLSYHIGYQLIILTEALPSQNEFTIHQVPLSPFAEKCHLDVRAAEPAVVPVARASANLALLLAGPEEADEGGSEEADGQEEREGNVGLELPTRVAARRDVAPVEYVSAAVANQL